MADCLALPIAVLLLAAATARTRAAPNGGPVTIDHLVPAVSDLDAAV